MKRCPTCGKEMAFYTIRYKGDVRIIVYHCTRCKKEIEEIG